MFKNLIIFTVLFIASSFAFAKKETRLLVFSRTTGFRHESIKAGKLAMLKLGAENKFKVDTTEDASVFNEDNLKKYSTVIFLNTTGDVLNANQQSAFERYIQSGGGFVGIHAATDTEYEWPWYNKLVGAYFAGHPGNPNVRKGTINIIDHNHPSTKGFPDKWVRTDEFYDFKSMNPDIKVLAKVDEKSYEAGNMGENHPIFWYHAYDGGRVFYTNFGHTNETFSEPEFLKHLLGGIKYAVGDNKLDYSKAKSARL